MPYLKEMCMEGGLILVTCSVFVDSGVSHANTRVEEGCENQCVTDAA